MNYPVLLILHVFFRFVTCATRTTSTRKVNFNNIRLPFRRFWFKNWQRRKRFLKHQMLYSTLPTVRHRMELLFFWWQFFPIISWKLLEILRTCQFTIPSFYKTLQYVMTMLINFVKSIATICYPVTTGHANYHSCWNFSALLYYKNTQMYLWGGNICDK